MIDWTQSMKQSFEYYVVDPGTWRDISRLRFITSCTIDRDDESDTLGSASIDTTEYIGECYIRAYLVATQFNNKFGREESEKVPLGTFLVQTPSLSFDGKVSTSSLDAYTPLIELKENQPPLGYNIPKDSNIMDIAYKLCRENMRAPVVQTTASDKLYSDFVSDVNDTWIAFIKDLVYNAKKRLTLDEMGRVLFSPIQDLASMQPVWTFNDDNSSILMPDISMDQDLYNMPNVVEVIYSNGNETRYARVVNDDPNSPLSTIRRGREITHRITDTGLAGVPTNAQLEEYAVQQLKALSSVEYTISYTHGFVPIVRVGDCVRLNYKRAGIEDIKAKVISQSIKCESGISVTEKAIFSKKLWR